MNLILYRVKWMQEDKTHTQIVKPNDWDQLVQELEGSQTSLSFFSTCTSSKMNNNEELAFNIEESHILRDLKCYYSTSRVLSFSNILDVDCLTLYPFFIKHLLFPSLSCKNVSQQRLFPYERSVDTFQTLIWEVALQGFSPGFHK